MKIIKFLIFLILSLFTIQLSLAVAPSFNEFREWMYNDSNWQWVFKLWVDPTWNLKDNIVLLFYPEYEWALWITIRNIWVWIFIVYLIWAGFWLLFKAQNDWDLKKAKMNFMYMFYWAFLFFWSWWILSYGLEISSFRWTQWQNWLISNLQHNLFLQILGFLKAWAFFVAILMIVYYWFEIIKAFEKEDKIKSAKKWVLNVIIALIFIKVIDYIFYIAQTNTFKSSAWELIVSASKIMWYVLWWLMVLSILYAWSILIFSWWKDDNWKKAKTIIVNVFLVSVIVMLFLLIVYQVISELA